MAVELLPVFRWRERIALLEEAREVVFLADASRQADLRERHVAVCQHLGCKFQTQPDQILVGWGSGNLLEQASQVRLGYA